MELTILEVNYLHKLFLIFIGNQNFFPSFPEGKISQKMQNCTRPITKGRDSFTKISFCNCQLKTGCKMKPFCAVIHRRLHNICGRCPPLLENISSKNSWDKLFRQPWKQNNLCRHISFRKRAPSLHNILKDIPLLLISR